MKVKVLFVPDVMASHVIPLLSLARMLDKGKYECCFLLQAQYHAFVQELGFRVLEIDHRTERKNISSELMAYGKCRPDVVVDDLSYTTAFAARFFKLPRISVVRTGILPFEVHNPRYKHSANVEFIFDKLKEGGVDAYGVWRPENVAALFEGDINLIPSIPSVEKLPNEIINKDVYQYTGSLLLNDDELMDNISLLKGAGLTDHRAAVDLFFQQNSNRKIVYFTAGLTYTDKIHRLAGQLIRILLNNGLAVVTNLVNVKIVGQVDPTRLYASSFLPMQTVCSRAHFMVHHCGSGTYNYQLQYQLPAILLGSMCYDRDEVALQLHSLRAGTYLSADLEDEICLQTFEDAVRDLLHTEKYAWQKKVLATLHKELIDTRENFDFGHTIDCAIKKYSLV